MPRVQKIIKKKVSSTTTTSKPVSSTTDPVNDLPSLAVGPPPLPEISIASPPTPKKGGSRGSSKRPSLVSSEAQTPAKQPTPAPQFSKETQEKLERQVREKLQQAQEKRKKREEERRKQIREQLETFEGLDKVDDLFEEVDFFSGLHDPQEKLKQEPSKITFASKVVERQYRPQAEPMQQSAGKNKMKAHLNKPARGILDQAFDHLLSQQPARKLEFKKQGHQDGVYLYGNRVVQIQLSTQDVPLVIVATQWYFLKDFLEKFEKVETVKMKGLATVANAAIGIQTFI